MKLYDEIQRMVYQQGYAKQGQTVLAKRSIASHTSEGNPNDGVGIGETVACLLTGTGPLEDYASVDTIGVGEAVTATLQLAGAVDEGVRVLENVLVYFPALAAGSTTEAVGVGETISTTLLSAVAEVAMAEGVTIGETVSTALDRDFWRTVTEGVGISETATAVSTAALGWSSRNTQFTTPTLVGSVWYPQYWGYVGPYAPWYEPDSGTAGLCYIGLSASGSAYGIHWSQSQDMGHQAPVFEANTAYTLTLISQCTITLLPGLYVTVRDQEGYYLDSGGNWSTTPGHAIERYPVMSDTGKVTTTLNFTTREAILNYGQGVIQVGVLPGYFAWSMSAKIYMLDIS